jgi:tRNA A37 threonylcarbamoyladenosine dehydratase
MAEFRIADFDTLSTANLNRVGSNLFNVNRNKTDVMADEVRKINPYHNVEKFKDGINEGNMESFLEGLDLLVEECDDFPMKVKIRMEAKKRKIPVIMVANLADSIVLDVERFDIEDSMILHGKLSQEELEYLVSGNTKKEEIQKFAVSFVGRENVPPRAIESVMDIGKKLVGRPQLMATANIGAGFMNFVGREILLKKGIKSGRYILKFDTLFA